MPSHWKKNWRTPFFVRFSKEKRQWMPIFSVRTKTNWTIQMQRSKFQRRLTIQEGRGKDRNYFLNQMHSCRSTPTSIIIISTTPAPVHTILRKCLSLHNIRILLGGLSCTVPFIVCLGEDIQWTFTTASWINQTNPWSLDAAPSKTF